MTRYQKEKLLKKLRNYLLFIVIIVGLILFGKTVIANRVNSVKDKYNKEVETFKENQEILTNDIIDNVLDIVNVKDDTSNAINEIKDVITNIASDYVSDNNESTYSDNNVTFTSSRLYCVIDGDTLMLITDESEEIADYSKYRLIGINTPESVHQDEAKNTVYGEYASDWLKSFMKDNGYNDDTPLYIEYDTEEYDIYGRKLAYIWLKKDVDTNSEDDIKNYMLNAILVENGYAEAVVYKPNVKYAGYFQKFYEEARESKVGLFAYEDFTEFDN